MIELEKIVPQNIFKVPKNYFENLSMAIWQRIEVSEEVDLNINKKQNFAIPENYFEGLSAKILSRISENERKNIILEDLERVNVFRVPENYFQELTINSGIERFGKTNTFKTPSGYFETLTEKILSKTTEKSSKVIHINWWSKSTVRWSAAASIILMVGLWFSVPQFTKSETELALEKVSNSDIKTYLETQDLSYLEYESALASAKNEAKILKLDTLEDLKVDKQAILEHLETQNLEEDI